MEKWKNLKLVEKILLSKPYSRQSLGSRTVKNVPKYFPNQVAEGLKIATFGPSATWFEQNFYGSGR
jgi:hypothetical protein